MRSNFRNRDFLWSPKMPSRLMFAAALALLLSLGGVDALHAQDVMPASEAMPAAAEEMAAEAPAMMEEAAAAVEEAAPAEEEPSLDTGDTAWMLTATALVLLMTIPGVALFYGGMVRKKNVLATVMQSFTITCLMTIVWMVVGYSLAFFGRERFCRRPKQRDAGWNGDGKSFGNHP